VTTTVLNHSYTTREVRVAVNVQIAYDSDVDLALKLLEEIGHGEPRVDKSQNPPAAFFASFGDSGINLQLGVWITDPENGQLNLQSTLNRAIHARFAEHGIRIAYPQREVRIWGENAPARPASATPENPA
jgi:small-conductance mechanosensitive channel